MFIKLYNLSNDLYFQNGHMNILQAWIWVLEVQLYTENHECITIIYMSWRSVSWTSCRV